MKMAKKVLFALLIIVVCAEVYCHKEASVESDDVILREPRGIRDRKKAVGGECRYKKGPWEECDSATNMERRTLTLKRGDSNCEQTKVLTRKCKKAACKYEKGAWNECDASTNTRSRTDSLKPKSDSSCEPMRTVSKKCKKGTGTYPLLKSNACRYNKQAAWSDCDATTGKKTKVLVLNGGDPSICEANKKITKPCRGGKKGGKGKHSDDDEEYDDDE